VYRLAVVPGRAATPSPVEKSPTGSERCLFAILAALLPPRPASATQKVSISGLSSPCRAAVECASLNQFEYAEARSESALDADTNDAALEICAAGSSAAGLNADAATTVRITTNTTAETAEIRLNMMFI
jgi:hypothetical protein